MSPAEKRYFKRHYGSTVNVLTDLFDTINAQDKYDESAIKELFPKKVADNLKVYKFQLEQQVLQSLISSGYFSTVGSKIRLGLEQVDILAERNLIDMAAKQLEKTRQLCLKYEEFPYLLEVNAKEFRLKYLQARNTGKMLESKFTEHRKYLSILEEINRLTELANEIGKLATSWPATSKKDQRKAKSYLSHPLLNKKYPNTPIRSAFTVSQALGNIYLILGNVDQARHHFQEGARLFDEDKNLKQHYAPYYLLTLQRCITIAIYLRDVACAKKKLQEINQFLHRKTQYLPHQIFAIKSELRLTILTAGEYEDQQKLERKISRLIRGHSVSNNKDLSELYLLMGGICIVNRQFDNAMDYLQIVATQDRSTWAYFQDITNVLELIIYFEQREQQHGRRKLAEMRQQGKQNNSHEKSPLTRDIRLLFQALFTNKHEAVARAEALHQKMNQHPSDRLTRQLLTICFPDWLKATLEERPLHAVLAEANSLG